MDFAKLMIAAAWADGALTHDEINALKDLLFTLNDVSAEDWTELNMYMDSPPTSAERQELIARVIGGIQSEDDKLFILETLERLFGCDGKVTPDEVALLAKIKDALSRVDTVFFSLFKRALASAVRQRRATARSTCLCEFDVEDYVKNPIYYCLQRKQTENKIVMDKPETEIRKHCLAAGLLAHVAHVDSDISADERNAISGITARDWNLSGQQAGLLVQIACDCTKRGLDYFRLSHGFFACTTYDERNDYLKTLFRIANATNKTGNNEIEEIRKVAKSLKLSHEDFIAAKLTIPREDRKGL